MGFIKFILTMITNKCVNCGKKATKYPHGVACCEECACDGECSSWVGGNCDCK